LLCSYQPPVLAISSLYWKAWTVLLILGAFNPASFGITFHHSYATTFCRLVYVIAILSIAHLSVRRVLSNKTKGSSPYVLTSNERSVVCLLVQSKSLFSEM